MTVTDGSGILINMYLSGNGIIGAPFITRQIQNNGPPGYSGGIGIYEISSSQNVSSTTIIGNLRRNGYSNVSCSPGTPKTDSSLIFFIRNYISTIIKRKYPNSTDQQIQQHISNIKLIKDTNIDPKDSIYDIITQYLYIYDLMIQQKPDVDNQTIIQYIVETKKLNVAKTDPNISIYNIIADYFANHPLS
jgi:hypothetical protein